MMSRKRNGFLNDLAKFMIVFFVTAETTGTKQTTLTSTTFDFNLILFFYQKNFYKKREFLQKTDWDTAVIVRPLKFFLS